MGGLVAFAAEESHQRHRARRGRGAYHASGDEGDAPRKSPHSVEAEESVLSCCVLDGASGADTLQRCREAGMRRESFYEPKNGILFAKLIELFDRGVPIDAAVLYQTIRADGLLEKIGGEVGFVQLTGRIPTTAQAPHYINEVMRLAHAREKAALADQLRRAAVEGDAEGMAAAELALREAEAYGHGALPPVMTWEGLQTRATPKPPELIAGVLHKGRRMILAGGSKSFKSWVLLDMAVAIATGTPWWGMATTQGKVLYVNFELPEWGLRDRLFEIAKARAEPNEEPKPSGGLEIWDLDGYGADIDALLPHFEARLLRGQYSLVILDPIYVCLGERDENSNGDVTQLMNRLAWLARRTGAGVAFGHHFSKGNQSERDAKDRASGAGAWIRAPDTVVTLTPHEEEGCFTASFVLRSQPQKGELVVRWKHPCMQREPGLNPADLKTAGRPKVATWQEVAELLRGQDLLTWSEWWRLAERDGMTKSTFKRRSAEAVEGGHVVQVGTGYKLK
jgi:hypothetical protein